MKQKKGAKNSIEATTRFAESIVTNMKIEPTIYRALSACISELTSADYNLKRRVADAQQTLARYRQSVLPTSWIRRFEYAWNEPATSNLLVVSRNEELITFLAELFSLRHLIHEAADSGRQLRQKLHEATEFEREAEGIACSMLRMLIVDTRRYLADRPIDINEPVESSKPLLAEATRAVLAAFKVLAETSKRRTSTTISGFDIKHSLQYSYPRKEIAPLCVPPVTVTKDARRLVFIDLSADALKAYPITGKLGESIRALRIVYQAVLAQQQQYESIFRYMLQEADHAERLIEAASDPSKRQRRTSNHFSSVDVVEAQNAKRLNQLRARFALHSLVIAAEEARVNTRNALMEAITEVETQAATLEAAWLAEGERTMRCSDARWSAPDTLVQACAVCLTADYLLRQYGAQLQSFYDLSQEDRSDGAAQAALRDSFSPPRK